ncbi:TetR/AcrR family transcriptional regulator [Alkalicoccobacillus plakortidis]|uniref:TetR/AcrR family transcriptional regulator n=1 Tax=Alkalicoccobacillus plakortidis TaxID=444060 RepID=A0ABT0XM73_9BACI|nr:TetR/AcrR family transcriptional regulator [Alkalicoccobacillus plakortidis]MCM2676830.1 TetR/AcrR family transcriptional regulator [Alkalicoccobacillus plakortidis]
MTADEIKKAALYSFGRNGFDGASLAKIAEEVGIKKQSIYTHYKNKDELFLTVLEDSLKTDLNYLTNWAEKYKEQSLQDFLNSYLQLLGQRFENEDSFRFGLRISFFPPDHLYDAVMGMVLTFESRCEEIFIPKFEQAVNDGLIEIEDTRSAVLAYLSILDAIFVELIYGKTERATLKMNALWKIYWRGLAK